LTSTLADLGNQPGARTVVSHEGLCQDARAGFRAVIDSFGLEWSPMPDRLLDELNRPGRGYETTRVANGLADVWRTRLSPELVREARSVFDGFPLREQLMRVGVSS
jgi:hypothetical protein